MNDQSSEISPSTSLQDDSPFHIDFALLVIFFAATAAWAGLIIYSMGY